MGFKLTTDAMDRLWPHAPHSLIDGMVSTSEAVFDKYGICTLPELADLLAQGSEETGGGWDIEEDLNYSAARLCQVWPERFPSIAYAVPFAHNPRLLADSVYGSRYGNRLGTDDGYNFRGRGFIQVTFRSWYQQLSAVTGLDLVGNPNLVNGPLHFLEVGAAFWKIDGINVYADRNDFRGETLRLNGGYTNYPARVAWRSTCRRALGLAP
jgi:putative chitinase